MTAALHLPRQSELGSMLRLCRTCRRLERRGEAAVAIRVLGLRTAIILGGGAGSRLYPLTKQRAKPAVPIGGAYRLIDVPMSNCINSGISKIYVLTQFNSTSLNRHLARTYNFGNGEAYQSAASVVACILRAS
jgi:Nucleotidyl transferase